MCQKHYKRWYRESKPFQSAYANLKNNSKRRGKNFTITFVEFRDFAIATKLLMNKGRSMDSYTIDRIDNGLGYIPGNIQAISKRDNIKKYHVQKKLIYDYRTKYAIMQKMPYEMDGSDAPY